MKIEVNLKQEQQTLDLESSFKMVYKAGATEINNSYKGAAARALRRGNNEPMMIYKNNKRAIEHL